MDDWQPIETAPKDMTVIIGLLPNGDVTLVWYFAPSSITFGWCRRGRGKIGSVKPTHWIPKPKYLT